MNGCICVYVYVYMCKCYVNNAPNLIKRVKHAVSQSKLPWPKFHVVVFILTTFAITKKLHVVIFQTSLGIITKDSVFIICIIYSFFAFRKLLFFEYIRKWHFKNNFRSNIHSYMVMKNVLNGLSKYYVKRYISL